MTPAGTDYALDLPGLPLMVSEYIPRDSGIVDRETGRVWLHPFAVIYLEHEGDPLARLAAVERYVVDRAHRELDQLEERILAGVENPTIRAALEDGGLSGVRTAGSVLVAWAEASTTVTGALAAEIRGRFGVQGVPDA